LVTNYKDNQSRYQQLQGKYKFGRDFYFFPGAEVHIRAIDSSLYIGGSRGAMTVLIPQGKNKYLDRMSWAYITFEEDANGKVKGYNWKYDNETFFAAKVDE
jgi:hypothetical protein